MVITIFCVKKKVFWGLNEVFCGENEVFWVLELHFVVRRMRLEVLEPSWLQRRFLTVVPAVWQHHWGNISQAPDPAGGGSHVQCPSPLLASRESPALSHSCQPASQPRVLRA